MIRNGDKLYFLDSLMIFLFLHTSGSLRAPMSLTQMHVNYPSSNDEGFSVTAEPFITHSSQLHIAPETYARSTLLATVIEPYYLIRFMKSMAINKIIFSHLVH